MPLATTKIFSQTVADQQQLFDAFKVALGHSGLTLIDEEFGTSAFLWVSLSPEVLLEIKILSTMRVSHRLLFGTIASNTASRESTAKTFVSGSITFNCCNHPEMQVILAKQGDRTYGLFGYISPANPPDWWNLAQFPYYFIFNNERAELISFQAELSPFANYPYAFDYFEYLKDENPVTHKRELIDSVLIYSTSTNGGIAGKCSEDVARAAATGLNPGDILIDSAQRYYLILGSTGTSALSLASSWPEEV